MDSNFRKTFTNLQQIDDQESGHISDDSDECEDKENNINSQNTVDLTLESKNEEVSTCNKTRYDLRKRNASNQQVPKKAKKRPRTKVPLAKYQNPDRLLYHVKTNLPIKNDEPEAEECYEWLRQLSLRQIDDFVDLNEGEKAFMKLWNAHLHLNPCYGDRMLVRILEEFIDEYGIRIYRRNLQRNLTLHLSNMHSFAAISPTTMIELITRFQKLVKDSLDFPEKYPVTPEKVPIENPYYKPKPMSLEDQSLYAKHSNTKSCQNTSNSIDLYQQANTKQKKSFWVRKCLKKRPMVNNNDEEEDLKLWPRKKSSVTFANELFIDEILDLNDTSSAMTKQSNFISDFNDMYKFTLISPRRNRRSKS